LSLDQIKIPTIYYGRGSLKQLKYFKQKRILIVTDNIINKLYGDKIQRILKNIVEYITDVCGYNKYEPCFPQIGLEFGSPKIVAKYFNGKPTLGL